MSRGAPGRGAVARSAVLIRGCSDVIRRESRLLGRDDQLWQDVVAGLSVIGVERVLDLAQIIEGQFEGSLVWLVADTWG
jgi:hypothetical protein